MEDSTEHNNTNNTKMQIVMLGGGGVGKSSLTEQFVNSAFHDEYDPTILNSYKKTIRVDNVDYELEVTDTAGQDEYESIRSQCIKECNAFMIVYDLTNSNSLFDLQKYMLDIERAKDGEIFALVICGNKSDLHAKNNGRANEIPPAVQELVSRYSCPHFFTSAKEHLNVNEAFSAVVEEVNKIESKELLRKEHQDHHRSSLTQDDQPKEQQQSNSSFNCSIL